LEVRLQGQAAPTAYIGVETLRKRSGHDPTVDGVLDSSYEPVVIAGQPYAVSEALYATDREAYLAVAATVEESRNVLGELSARYTACLKSELREVSFVHYADTAYLKTSNDKGRVVLEDTSFVSDGADRLYFPPAHSPDENADLLVHRLDPYSIINCFDLFTQEAAARVAQAYGAGTLDSLYPPPVTAVETP
jgi:hypothetical protein